MTDSKRFELQFFTYDENDKEDFVIEGRFPTVESAEDRANNIGSRWIFYPNVRIWDRKTDKLIAEYYNEDGYEFYYTENTLPVVK